MIVDLVAALLAFPLSIGAVTATSPEQASIQHSATASTVHHWHLFNPDARIDSSQVEDRTAQHG